MTSSTDPTPSAMPTSGAERERIARIIQQKAKGKHLTTDGTRPVRVTESSAFECADEILASSPAMPMGEGLVEALEALDEIAEGKGRYSRDPYEHACNTIDDMKEIARAAAERLRALLSAQETEPSGWRDLASAPKDGSFILVCDVEGHIDVARWAYGRFGGFPHLTHWMPLPKRPSAPEDRP